MNKKVIAAGHICIDITPTIISKEVEKIQDIMIPGSLVNVKEADIHTGGSVANTGLAMKLLGNDITLLGKIGDDAFGDMVYSIVDGYNAAEGLIRKKGEHTSYSVVLAVPGIDRIFLHDPGANDTFSADDISKEMIEGTTLFHFGYPTLMKKMYEDDGNDLVRLFRFVKENGCATSLDLAAINPDSDAGRINWEIILEKVLPYTDIFVPSIEELMFMMDREKFEDTRRKAGAGDFCEVLDIEKDIVSIADRCKQMGAKIVLIKCGAPGMYLSTLGKEELSRLPDSIGLDNGAWENISIFEKSYKVEKVVSGTGAGDTSIAAFLTALLQGYGPKECLQFATAEGASCVSAYDALGGIKTLDELKVMIDSGWEKMKG